MNQKGFINIAIIVLIVVIAGVAGYFGLRKTSPAPVTPSTSTQETTITNQTLPSTSVSNTFSANINGYFETCMDSVAMYKRINGSWEKVSNKLPLKRDYYLDDKFVGSYRCHVACSELPNPYTMQLIEYKKVGEKTPPPDSGSAANTLPVYQIPVYQTVSLSGDVKIDIQYFSDKSCQNKKTFSTVIKR